MFKPKVLILGSSGMLGHQLYFFLSQNSNFQLFDISKSMKLTNNTSLYDIKESFFLNYILKLKPDFIINCIGILIKESINNPDEAIYINSYLPHKLVKIANEIKATLVHLSTDCVFSGKRGSYKETDHRDGDDIYALSKILGEVLDNNHLTLRTSIVGPEIRKKNEGLFDWFMKQKTNIFGYTKVFWSGVTTFELSKAIMWSINNKITGLYHVTNNLPISKYELLLLFNKYSKKNLEIIPDDKIVSDKTFIDTKNFLDYKIPSYDDMISVMVNNIFKNKVLYPHYNL